MAFSGAVCIVLLAGLLWTLQTPETFALRPDWQSFIDPELLKKYLGKNSDSQYATDKFEGDMDGIDAATSEKELSIHAANVITNERARWENGIVPFVISPSFRPMERNLINKAMKAISALTFNCIKFQRQTNETDYVEFTRGLSCYSNIGRQGSKQMISLVRGCMENLGDIQHEIMHALGFFHELSRSDRKKYIDINWDNIRNEPFHCKIWLHRNLMQGETKEGIPACALCYIRWKKLSYKDQFKEYAGNTFGLPYDYSSVMHYPFNAFAIDSNLPTLIPKRVGARIGQNKNLSPLDVAKIQMAYKCDLSSVFDDTTTVPGPTDVSAKTVTVAGNDPSLEGSSDGGERDASGSRATSSVQLCPMFQDGTQCGCFQGKCWGYVTENSKKGDEWCYTQIEGFDEGMGKFATCTSNRDCSWNMLCADNNTYTDLD